MIFFELFRVALGLPVECPQLIRPETIAKINKLAILLGHESVG